MSYLNELKEFVVLHGKAQNLDPSLTKRVLTSIQPYPGREEGNWVERWSQEGRKAHDQQRWLDAMKLYNLARFPFVRSQQHVDAYQACQRSFKAWLTQTPLPIERLEIKDGPFFAYASGLDRGWPLLIITGGIISLKEQWHRFLLMAERLKRCVVVCEMPQVGENNLPYQIESARMYSLLIDALAQRADISHTHCVALSFSGQLALLAAQQDRRIQAITTVGAPGKKFFAQTGKLKSIPLVTRATLAHLMRCSEEALPAGFQPWLQACDRLQGLVIPVYYLSSLRDEVLPPGEAETYAKLLPKLHVLALDDVHASPNHFRTMALWLAWSILQEDPRQPAARRLLHALLAIALTFSRKTA